jgi:hypothetical protein
MTYEQWENEKKELVLIEFKEIINNFDGSNKDKTEKVFEKLMDLLKRYPFLSEMIVEDNALGLSSEKHNELKEINKRWS